MKNKSLLLFLSLMLAAAGHTQENLQEIIERYETFESTLTKDYKSSWPVLTDVDAEKRVSFYRQTLEQLQALERHDMSEKESINADMLSYILGNTCYLLEYDTRLMPLNAEGGFLTSMLYSMGRTSLSTEEARKSYLSKLRETSYYLSYQKDMLSRGLVQDRIHPDLVVRNCLNILDGILEKEEDNFFLFRPARDAGLELDAGLKQVVIEAFQEFRRFLEKEYLPFARNEIGVSANKDGKDFYEQRVRYFTSLELSPIEVYEKGLKEVARIRSEMEALVKELGFDGGLPEFIDMLKNDPQFYASTERELLYYASWLSKRAEAILPAYFGKLPRLPFTVKPVPEDIAVNYTTGRYSGGSMENAKAGEYWVNTYKLESRPLYMMTALTLHEAVPGHHLQGSLARELEDLPEFRSEYLSAFGEGWGLYSEYLGREAGMYETLYDLFGSLSYEMWRACRLVVDPGMHYMGWTRDQAVSYMKENTSLTDHEIENEIDRYIGWPGQAVSYKIGEIKIKALRHWAESELGDAFDIREFHDTLLANGSVPLNTLERIVKNYINEKKKG